MFWKFDLHPSSAIDTMLTREVSLNFACMRFVLNQKCFVFILNDCLSKFHPNRSLSGLYFERNIG